jgi:dienelactone hydrolase
MKTHFSVTLTTLCLAGALLSCASRPALGEETSPVVSAATAPTGTGELSVQWVRIESPGVGVMLAAIARPQGPGPFSSIMLLHGSHGFAQEYVRLAQDLAREGFLAIAACWFSGGGGEGARFITPIGCPDAPAMPVAASREAQQIVDTLVQAVRLLPDADRGRVALFGHSRGGGAALNYALNSGNVQVVMLNSTGYPSELADRASQINVPVLMLHGTADGPADGGAPVTGMPMATNFETALRRAGKTVQVKYYEGGRHNSLFDDATQREDEVRRMVTFLREHLRGR